MWSVKATRKKLDRILTRNFISAGCLAVIGFKFQLFLENLRLLMVNERYYALKLKLAM